MAPLPFKTFQLTCLSSPTPHPSTTTTARCQRVFLDQLELGPNIAKNEALCENVFMMVTCIDLRIPLFLVGKPGSSKSLAKTVVTDAMQGDSSPSLLYRCLKQVSANWSE